MIFFQNLTENFPILSLIFSLILIIGFYQLGELILISNSLRSIFKNISELKYQKILIGINFAMFFLFPLVLFFKHSKYFLSFISIFIFCLGLFKIFTYLKKKKSIKILTYGESKFEYLLFLTIIIGYFLICFSPVNHADSLSYHLVGAEYIFKTGKLPTTKSWTELPIKNFQNPLYFLFTDCKVSTLLLYEINQKNIAIKRYTFKENDHQIPDNISQQVTSKTFENLKKIWLDEINSLMHLYEQGYFPNTFEKEDDLTYCSSKILLRLPEKKFQYEL